MYIFMVSCWIISNSVAAFPTNDTICAVVYDDYENNTDFFLEILHNQEIANLRQKQTDEVRWTNMISHVQVTGGCTLFGYNKPDYELLLGSWENDYKMSTKEDNKLSSLRCICQPTTTTTTTTMTTTTMETTTVPLTCRGQYYGAGNYNSCPTPLCNVAQLTIIDSWKSQLHHMLNGYVARISIPPAHYDSNGWTVLLRYNIAPENFQGNFQIWNADFFNIYRKEAAVEILIHQTHSFHTDGTDPHSFVFVAERLSSSVEPDVFFWSRREWRHQCFMNGSSMGRSTEFDRALAAAVNVSTKSNVGQVAIRRSGRMRVKT